MRRARKSSKSIQPAGRSDAVLDEIVDRIEVARRRAARAVNATMTAVYWSIGRRIVVEEQRGARRAEYGEELIERLAARLTARFGRGFGRANLWQMRAFYLDYQEILQTASGEFVSEGGAIAARLPLPWSHYVKLLGVKNELARRFYETEALRGGWTVRQLDRQIQSKQGSRGASVSSTHDHLPPRLARRLAPDVRDLRGRDR